MVLRRQRHILSASICAVDRCRLSPHCLIHVRGPRPIMSHYRPKGLLMAPRCFTRGIKVRGILITMAINQRIRSIYRPKKNKQYINFDFMAAIDVYKMSYLRKFHNPLAMGCGNGFNKADNTRRTRWFYQPNSQ